MNRCRTCKAPIIWARTENGHAIPLDADPDEHGNIALAGAGPRIAVVVSDRELRERLDVTFYTSHFATCPHADDHRRNRRPI